MQPSIVHSQGLFKMWYVGTDGLNTGIGYAVSLDGIQWNRVLDDPLLILGPEWPGPVKHPSVVLEQSGGLSIFFSGDLLGGSVGRSTSSDGIEWTNATVTMTPGLPGSWDAGGVGEPTVVRTPSGYSMWYVGVDEYGSNASIGFASSSDGTNWTRHPTNPVIQAGTTGWSLGGVQCPTVSIQGDGTYDIWMAGHDRASYRIIHGSSKDGLDWGELGLVLDIGQPATADGSNATDPSSVGGDDRMWYSGFDGVTWRILIAMPSLQPPPPLIATPTTVAFAFFAGLGAVGSTVFLTSERFKYALFGLPLALGLVKERKLDPFVRGQIYQYIKENPGEYFSNIMTGISASNGNLTYHLRILEKQGFITSSRDGKLIRFYPRDMPIPQDNGIRFSPLQLRLLREVSREPGINQTRLANLLGIKKQTVAYNVYIMAEFGVLKVKKLRRETFIYLIKEED